VWSTCGPPQISKLNGLSSPSLLHAVTLYDVAVAVAEGAEHMQFIDGA
jgi:hypothetical protein